MKIQDLWNTSITRESDKTKNSPYRIGSAGALIIAVVVINVVLTVPAVRVADLVRARVIVRVVDDAIGRVRGEIAARSDIVRAVARVAHVVCALDTIVAVGVLHLVHAARAIGCAPPCV